jgi:A32 protein
MNVKKHNIFIYIRYMLNSSKKLDTKKKGLDEPKKLSKELVNEFNHLAHSKNIPNYYEFIKKADKDLIIEVENPNFDLHQIPLPSRGLIVAPSGTGKTNFLLHMLNCFNQGKGTFTSIRVICSSKAEPIYDFIQRRCPNIEITEGINTLPKLDPEIFDKKENHLIFLDDLVLERNQERISKYFMMCRKLNISVFYLSQKFFTIPLFIRQNATLFFLLHLGNARDIKNILSTISVGVDNEELIQLYKEATEEKMCPLRIDITERDINKKFKKGLIEPLEI